MNPQLRILKGKIPKDYVARRNVHFAVVDQDKPKTYPANFICILPQHMSSVTEDSSVFARIFKEKRIETAMKLLNDALESEDDPQIKKVIVERLRQLEPKPIWQVRNYH
jgi:hypothetical protein